VAVLAIQRFIAVSNVDGVSAIKATGTLADVSSPKPATLLFTSDNAMRLEHPRNWTDGILARHN
jgi:hypothetical protein